MEVEKEFRDESNAFRPVDITISLETQEDFEMLRAMFARNMGIPELMKTTQYDYVRWQDFMGQIHDIICRKDVK